MSSESVIDMASNSLPNINLSGGAISYVLRDWKTQINSKMPHCGGLNYFINLKMRPKLKCSFGEAYQDCKEVTQLSQLSEAMCGEQIATSSCWMSWNGAHPRARPGHKVKISLNHSFKRATSGDYNWENSNS